MTSWSKVSASVLLGITAGMLFQATSRLVKRGGYRVEPLTEVHKKMLASLANTVEMRDPYTRGHSEQVARNAVVMGRVLGFSRSELEDLYWSALLHDLGKIGVPETILLKEGVLRQGEFDIVKQHPDYGADLLLTISRRYSHIAAVVRAHHERYDGTGYPKGLAGEAIPLMSRIISIADVYEALTSRRPYREPMTCEDALHYLAKGDGQFDQALVAVFEQCYRRGQISCSSSGSPSFYPFITQHPDPSTSLSRMPSS